MASIKKRRETRFLAACYRLPNGKRVQRSTGTDDPVLAQTIADKLDAGKYGRKIDPSGISANPSAKPFRSKEASLYLMKCEATGLIKIGMSANPKVRERTLLSQSPAIRLIRVFKGMGGLEKQLHKKFQDKRVRGEWFRLTPSDIAAIERLAS